MSTTTPTFDSLYTQICRWDNLYLAYRQARRGKRGRIPAATFEFHLEENLVTLQMKESPIFSKTYDLLLWLIPTTLKFPREQRFLLARAIQETALRFQEDLLEAGLSRDRERNRALGRADVNLAKLRFYLRLCRDLQLITLSQYQFVAESVTEIGRLLGGWRQSVTSSS